jgi:hypothetical protein
MDNNNKKKTKKKTKHASDPNKPNRYNEALAKRIGMHVYPRLELCEVDARTGDPFSVMVSAQPTERDWRGYLWFKNTQHLLDVVGKKNYNLYELVRTDRPRHFFADIEWETPQLPPVEKVLGDLMVWIGKMLAEADPRAKEAWEKRTPRLSGSSGIAEKGPLAGKHKTSLHFACQTTLAFRDQDSFKRFYLYMDARARNPRDEEEERILENLWYVKGDKKTTVWDMAIAGSRQNFRLLHQSKGGSKRVLNPWGPDQSDCILDHLVGIYGPDVEFFNIPEDLAIVEKKRKRKKQKSSDGGKEEKEEADKSLYVVPENGRAIFYRTKSDAEIAAGLLEEQVYSFDKIDAAFAWMRERKLSV